MDTILVAEDEKLIRHLLKENLEKEDFLVIEAANGKRTLDILSCQSVNLILLDLRLPDTNGVELLPLIRELTAAPVIIVSGDSNRKKKIECLQKGADDYVVKPFQPDLLLALIKANLRRAYSDISNENKASKDNKKIKFLNWILDKTQYQVFDKNEQSADLTSREFELLSALVDNHERVLTREELSEAIREDNYKPSPRAIDVKITRIRKKLKDSGEIILTIRGVGYKFNGDKIEK